MFKNWEQKKVSPTGFRKCLGFRKLASESILISNKGENASYTMRQRFVFMSMLLKVLVGMKQGTEGRDSLYGFSPCRECELGDVSPNGRLINWDTTVPKVSSPGNMFPQLI
ncbi:unnamed protein product [Lepeophtheirus salmonis]|uniref:(salmon louse) hypothetical protein n=1 Tax=Lepeophtheirus salmonis TaxID=72036 RepID=A0A7R8D266_LEPSM|nr:unnamed protein product [Lepeophtheirus salmonis]CAF2972667.1 unnamed protein product [Lepeophtheirus salmonis]